MTGNQPGVAPAWRMPLIVGIFLLLLAAASLLESFKLPPGAAMGIGPAVAMQIIAAILALLGAAHIVQSWNSRTKTNEPSGEVSANSWALAWVLGGLLAQIALLAFGAGFIVSTAVLFVATACGFGKPLKSAGPVYGLLLCVAVYLFFTKVLGLTLPAGPLEQMLFS